MKKTLIVIDMQNDFIDGALGTEQAAAVVPRVKKKIEQYRMNGDEIIFTRDTHREDYLKSNEGKYLPVEHCIEGTDGWRIRKELEVAGAVCINKPTFGYLDWDRYKLEEVEIVGLCTDICVVSNALLIKTIYPDIKVTVDAACCAGVTPESHRAALLTMRMCQVEIINEEQ